MHAYKNFFLLVYHTQKALSSQRSEGKAIWLAAIIQLLANGIAMRLLWALCTGVRLIPVEQNNCPDTAMRILQFTPAKNTSDDASPHAD
jgi:hypothetical protein